VNEQNKEKMKPEIKLIHLKLMVIIYVEIYIKQSKNVFYIRMRLNEEFAV